MRHITPAQLFYSHIKLREKIASAALNIRVDKTVGSGIAFAGRSCNLSCSFCHGDSMHEPVARPAVENKFIVESVERLSRIAGGTANVYISGNGEPTRLGEELVGLVHLLRKSKAVNQLSLTTNGVALYKIISPLADSDISYVNVSLHALNRQSFIDLTGRDRLPSVLFGINSLRRLGIPVSVNAVVLGNTVDDLEHFLGFSSDSGVVIKFFPLNGFADENFTELAACLRLNAQFIREYSAPYGGEILSVNGAVVDLKNSSANLCRNLSCLSRPECDKGKWFYSLKMTRSGFLLYCPPNRAGEHYLDLADPSLTDEKIRTALLDCGRLS